MVKDLLKIKINFWLIGILIVIALLRVPSWFEPHWYGDEEIYLVLGQMIRRGAVLYRDVWDNKTPLLYFIYSLSPTLLWAKLTATVCILGTMLGVFNLSKMVFEDKPTFYPLVSTAFVGSLLSLPVLEGTIANAELYFILPIILGVILIYKQLTNAHRVQAAMWVGLLAATSFLLKVPAIFDFVGLSLAYFLIKLVDEYWSATRNFKKFLSEQVRFYFPVVISFAVPVGLVFLYFFANHALADFITAVFKQNVNYVVIDSGLFQKLTNPLYVKAAIFLTGVVVVVFSYFKKYVSREFVFLAFWFGFSLYGTLLSNRPYRHYLLQVVPPAVVLILYLVAHLKRSWMSLLFVLSVLYVVSLQFRGAFALDSKTYYQNFFAWASEQRSWEDYTNYFDGRTGNDYRVAKYISQNTNSNDPIFVWGDVASIYTISDRPAATKFIQAHHLTILKPDTYDHVIARLLKYQPKFIVVTRPVLFNFAALEFLLSRNYKEVMIAGNLYVYQNTAPFTPPAWSPKY